METQSEEKIMSKEELLPKFGGMDKTLENIYAVLVAEIDKQIKLYTTHTLSQLAKENIKQHIIKYGAREVLESVFISIEQYYDPGNSEESFTKMVDYIGKICFTRHMDKHGGMISSVNYILKIAKNRFNVFDEKYLKNILFKYMTIENMEDIKNIVAFSDSWGDLQQALCNKLNIEL